MREFDNISAGSGSSHDFSCGPRWDFMTFCQSLLLGRWYETMALYYVRKNDFNRNLTVYCCVIQRLVTSDGSDGTQNDPGHPENEWE